MDFLPKPLEGLRMLNQFITYKLVESTTRLGKTEKLPFDLINNRLINAHDSTSWMSFDKALSLSKTYGPPHGVGLVFTKHDPYFFIDIDECLLPNGTWNELATTICNAFVGCAVEISSSGRGLHIFGRGTIPDSLPHVCKNLKLHVEFYTSGRFAALTGTSIIGDIDFDASAILPWFITTYVPASAPTQSPVEWTSQPADDWSGPESDPELLKIALQSRSLTGAFNNKASFFDLWTRNEIVLAANYPDPSGTRAFDESSADAALAQHLAFWAGNNCERIQRLMLMSQLRREKWDREDYLPRTILQACSRQTDFFSTRSTSNEVITQTDTQGSLSCQSREVQGTTILGAAAQMELFKGCVYVRDEHRILVPGGDLLKSDQFRAHFGGFSFVVTHDNQKFTRNAWESFTESQVVRHPRVTSTCFRPDLEPGAIIHRDGQDLVNIYWPVNTARLEGDVSLFLNHLAKIIRDENDRTILLSYMAAIVQYPGVKFKWAPVLQGTPGNGKTLFNLCLAEAVGRKYSHAPKASEIADKYNDWLYKNLFIGVDDIYIPHKNREIIEALKPKITEEYLEIRGMYEGKVMRDICCNFFLNCNLKEAVPKEDNDRRFAIFFTTHQSREDLINDGLTGDYFPRLYRWLEREKGFAMVTHYLANYKIPDRYNPAFKTPAPLTTSTQEAIEQSLGMVEQHILEAIAQQEIGFKGGWVSSIYLTRLLEHYNLHFRVPLSRRRAMMQTIGYDWHPALLEGRTSSVVLPDGGRPILYIKRGNVLRTLVDPKEVESFYTQAQGE